MQRSTRARRGTMSRLWIRGEGLVVAAHAMSSTEPVNVRNAPDGKRRDGAVRGHQSGIGLNVNEAVNSSRRGIA